MFFQAKTGVGYNRTNSDIGVHPYSRTGNEEVYGAVLFPSADTLLQQQLNIEEDHCSYSHQVSEQDEDSKSDQMELCCPAH